jgi:hypothetical protein
MAGASGRPSTDLQDALHDDLHDDLQDFSQDYLQDYLQDFSQSLMHASTPLVLSSASPPTLHIFLHAAQSFSLAAAEVRIGDLI